MSICSGTYGTRRTSTGPRCNTATPGEVLIDDDFDDVKIVGIYSWEQAAAAAISRAQMRPRFAEEPDCFTIDICTVDEDSWTDGFVTIPVRSD